MKTFSVYWYMGSVTKINTVLKSQEMCGEDISTVPFISILPEEEQKRFESSIRYALRTILFSPSVHTVDYGSHSYFILIKEGELSPEQDLSNKYIIPEPILSPEEKDIIIDVVKRILVDSLNWFDTDFGADKDKLYIDGSTKMSYVERAVIEKWLENLHYEMLNNGQEPHNFGEKRGE